MEHNPDDTYDDGVVPDLEEGMGLGAWLADGEKDNAPEDAAEKGIEGTASAQMRPLKERNVAEKKRLRPFEQSVLASIEEANKGRRE